MFSINRIFGIWIATTSASSQLTLSIRDDGNWKEYWLERRSGMNGSRFVIGPRDALWWRKEKQAALK